VVESFAEYLPFIQEVFDNLKEKFIS